METTPAVEVLEKLPSGIEGLDDITGGGLPQRRTTLLMGASGCGKTMLALQMLVSAATHHRIPGIFVAFEENAARVAANAATFGWDMGKLQKKRLRLIDARMPAEVIKAGAFDLTALLAALEAIAAEIHAGMIVFDAIDVLLSLLDDPASECRELYRLHQWLSQHQLTGVLTTKVEDCESVTPQRYGFMPFMADCTVLLTQRVSERVAARSIRVLKYRGSPHVLNEVPFVIGSAGVEVGSSNGVHPEPQPFKERVSTGVGPLDAMLGGGFFRGTNVLITGSSGTGKSMLAGAFIDAASRRKERALFISFDENSRDIVRDLSSLSIDLTPWLAGGFLRMEALRTEAASSEEHFMRIRRIIADHRPHCVVIDPLSALARVGGGLAARAVAERLIYLCRNQGITVLFTSLAEGTDPQLETTTLHLSTIADSWIQLSYSLQGGERNRALSIIKSRGSKHSNQLRELVFGDNGITLADSYAAHGEVLMGTLRIEKENAMRAGAERMRHEIAQKRREIEVILAERDLRLEAAQRDLRDRSEELDRLWSAQKTSIEEGILRRDEVVHQRDGELLRKSAPLARPATRKPASSKTKRRRKTQ